MRSEKKVMSTHTGACMCAHFSDCVDNDDEKKKLLKSLRDRKAKASTSSHLRTCVCVHTISSI